MTKPLTSFVDFLLSYDAQEMRNLPSIPSNYLQHAKELSKTAQTPSEALEGLEQLMPRIANFAPANEILIAYGTLLEKTRQKTKMLDSWKKIHDLYPDDPLAVRMMLRWYRRESLSNDGIAMVATLADRWINDPKHSEKIILAYKEIQAFDELDAVIPTVFETHPNNDRLKYLYVLALRDQGRLQAARTTAQSIRNIDRLGAQAVENLEAVMDQVLETVAGEETDTPGSIIGNFVAPFTERDIPLPSDNLIGQVVFYTGQLGAGGAERQMTRIAAAMQKAFVEDDGAIGEHRLTVPPKVCVRDIDAGSGKDFFYPVLQSAGVDTCVLADQLEPDLGTLNLTSQQLALFRLLPEDVRSVSLKLSKFLRSEDAEVVYYWQDGAILTGAIAALLAGVPRILATFRGMPPNIRTEFFRPEYFYLYRMLSKVPGVILNANSHATAVAYEDWLEIPRGSIGVLQNAVPDVSASGGASENAMWADIERKSPECQQTVIGVFRFDHNKRPQDWIKIAAAYVRKHSNTRFIIVGAGDETEVCQNIVRSEGMENRIFLVGRSKHVGFWMHKADLLMHLARFEGLPNVVIEAQLCQLPVLATPAGGTADVITHGQTGVILPNSDNINLNSIVVQLEEMLKTPEVLKSWGQLGRTQALEKFALQKVLSDTMMLFRS